MSEQGIVKYFLNKWTDGIAFEKVRAGLRRQAGIVVESNFAFTLRKTSRSASCRCVREGTLKEPIIAHILAEVHRSARRLSWDTQNLKIDLKIDYQ